MLRWPRGTSRWYRMTEGNHVPSVWLYDFVVISENLSRLMNRLNTAGFCFGLLQTSRLPAKHRPSGFRLTVIGTFLSGFGAFKML